MISSQLQRFRGSLLQLLPDASGVLRDSALLEHPLENFTEALGGHRW